MYNNLANYCVKLDLSDKHLREQLKRKDLFSS